jgi:hypothetical protein
MKLLFALVTLLFLGSCATKVPYTKEIKKEFNLTPDKLKGVQFYTSEAIILEREGEKQNISTTGEDGELVSSESSSSTRIIIPANRPCVFEKLEDDGTVQIRFEMGGGRVLRFAERKNISNGRFYLKAIWKNGKGEMDYGGSVYYAVRSSASAYLMVKLKKWKKNKKNDRVVKGMKI